MKALPPLLLILLTVGSAIGQDLNVRTRSIQGPKGTIYEADLWLVNTADQFLQAKLSAVQLEGKKTWGVPAITVLMLFAAKSDLYRDGDKRELSLIIDGDRFDLGTLRYTRYRGELRGDTLPPDARVRENTSVPDLTVGSLDILIFQADRVFSRIKRKSSVKVKLGPNRIPLTEIQINTLRDFIKSASG